MTSAPSSFSPPRRTHSGNSDTGLGKTAFEKPWTLVCYNDGPVALIVFDNSFARAVDPISSTLLDELTIWHRTKLPTKHVDSIEWLHDFRSVGHRSAFNDNCPDYPQLLTRVHSWLDPASPEHLTTSDIASLSPPRWLLDQLACGGLSTNDSFDTAKTILHEFRLTCVTNWQSRTPPQTEMIFI